MKKIRSRVVEPETNEITIINNSEELHELFDDLKKRVKRNKNS
ncbi:hypothetical protein [Saccharolobus caldissimus]|uniref:Uncharacterized protein n=1 Tax=Saccharolobus caldissimus TaxID=1702097 RepID=A0AAQ4CWT3_9CREN|nr:hypothetical protein [Saccharolobus caldissimus]BDC00265.1 hypothetical protein SACC_32810 [Saccharolobus caldissimus]